jgi:DNA processing protein
MMELYYIWLQELNGLSAWLKKELLAGFSSPKALFEADRLDLPEFVSQYPEWVAKFQRKDLSRGQAICEKNDALGIRALTIEAPGYLPKEKQTRNSPLVLYYKGNLRNPTATMIAIVGSRKATAYGKAAARVACNDYVTKGETILSGLALGIDAVAHETALTAGGITYAFVANGLDLCYPKENKRLMEDILSNGTLISPYPVGTAPTKYHFYVRNEIMTTWADEIIVVEGGEKSGAVMTGELALKNNRTVYAVPNNIFLITSAGSNRLLQMGAKAYLGEEQHKQMRAGTAKSKGFTSPDRLSSILIEEPRSAESIANLLGRPLDQVQGELFAMQMEDKVEFRPDGKWHFVGW